MIDWKDISGYEGLYQINKNGQIRSLDRIVTHSNGYSRLIKGKMIKPQINGSGYLQVWLHKEGKRYQPFVHKLVAETFIENKQNLKEVNHIDHNKLNCDVSNLEWCTRSENMIKSAEFYGTRQASNYCNGCNKEIGRESDLCIDCSRLKSRKTERPSKEELVKLIKTTPFTKIGEIYNVSDNAIRKWCKSYGLPTTKKEIKLLQNA